MTINTQDTNHASKIPTWFRLAYLVATQVTLSADASRVQVEDVGSFEQAFWPVQTPSEAVELLIETATRLAERADSLGAAVGYDFALKRPANYRSLNDAWDNFCKSASEDEVRTTPRATLISEKTRTAFGIFSQPSGQHVAHLSRRTDDQAHNLRWAFSLGGKIGSAIHALNRFGIVSSAQEKRLVDFWTTSSHAVNALEAARRKLESSDGLGGSTPKLILGDSYFGRLNSKLDDLEVELNERRGVRPEVDAAALVEPKDASILPLVV